jgi:ATP-binding cassette, subfamily B, beta-glucan exporter
MRFLRTYLRVLLMLGPDLKVAVFLGLANLGVATLNFIDPILFGRVIELLGRATEIPRAQLWTEATHLLGIWSAVGIGGIAANAAVALQAERMAHRNRLRAMNRYYSHVLSLPLSFYGETQSGRLMKAMIAGSESLFGVWLTFFRDQLATLLAALVLLPLTLFINWKLGSVLIALVVVFVTVTSLVILRTQAGQRKAEQLNSTLSGTAQDALSNVMVVQAFTRLSAETRLFSDLANEFVRHQFPVLNWWALVSVLTRASSTVAVIVIVAVGTLLHVQGEATVGQIVSFMGIATLLIGRLESAVTFTAALFSRLPALEDFFAILDAQSSVPEKPNAVVLHARSGEVVFEHVSFAYPGGPNILSDCDFIAKPGTTVALVGQTGAGKSTAMSLLQRLWDPSEGRITIDGQDLRDVTLESLRGAIGIVFQESLLFNRTIRENLLIGRPDATDADLERACQLADAHEFIIRQPQGYGTVIGERGSTLSGGQRQRLAIARALLKDPPILILDEATSALDAATEARVSKALAALMAGRTTFIIAHRLSTVRDADEILLFDSGHIAERGSFAQLLAKGGRFASLVSTQLTPAAVAD